MASPLVVDDTRSDQTLWPGVTGSCGRGEKGERLTSSGVSVVTQEDSAFVTSASHGFPNAQTTDLPSKTPQVVVLASSRSESGLPMSVP